MEALSIHVLHHNSAENLAALLGSLHLAWEHAEARHQDFDVRIEVLDSGSLPGVADAAERTVAKERYLWNERLGYHRVPIHRGYARGQAELLRRCTPRGYVFFVESEFEVNPDFFVSLRYYLNRSPEKRRLFCPVILDERRPRLGGRLDRWCGFARSLSPDSTEVPDYVGRNFMVPIKLFQADGGWNEAFSDEGEDLELSWRLGRKGWRVRPMREIVLIERTTPRQYDALTLRVEREIRGRGRLLVEAWPPHWRWAPRFVATLYVWGEVVSAMVQGRWPEAIGAWRGWFAWR